MRSSNGRGERMLAWDDIGVGMKLVAVMVSVRTGVVLKAGTVNPMQLVGWSRDEMRVRDRGIVQHQCREGGGRDYSGLVRGHHDGPSVWHRGAGVQLSHRLIILPTRCVNLF